MSARARGSPEVAGAVREAGAQILEGVGEHVRDALRGALQDAADDERGGVAGDPPVAPPDAGRADHVDQPVLVLQVQEGDAAGRRRPLPELRSNQAQIRAQGVRLAMNTVVQGTAADIIKIAMIRSHDALLDQGLSSRLVLQIHDELLFECPENEADAMEKLAREVMAGVAQLKVPLVIDVGRGRSWAEAH